MSRRSILSVLLLLSACRDRDKPRETPATAVATSSASSSASSTTPIAHSAVPPVLADEPMGDATRGKELATKMQCARCHAGLDIPAVDRKSHCIDCHQDILAGKLDAKPDAPRWRKNVAHLAVVPSLDSIGKRVQYSWLVRYIDDPHDLRPALTQMMPRLAITREEARDVAAYLVSLGKSSASEGDPLAGADQVKGRKLVDEMQCGSCHRMTGVSALAAATPLGPVVSATYSRTAEETRPAVMLAPDLRFTRDRSNAAQLIEWLLDPQAIKKNSPMPKTPMTKEQARDIAAYILRTPLDAAAAYAVPAALKDLDRKVTYGDVAKHVLDVTCRHCHGNPDDALGDGGPGNTGGFGFKPRGVNFTSYENVQGGYLDDKGERHSLFEKLPDGTPRIVASLWARHREIAGKPDPNVRGMPLGLPPLPPEEIQLFATWVAQGRPK